MKEWIIIGMTATMIVVVSLIEGSIVTWNNGTNQINSMSAAPLDNTTFGISYCDDTADDIIFRVFDTNGSSKTGEIVLDSTAGACDFYSTDFCPFNSTHGIVMWFDSAENDTSAALVDRYGNIVIPQFDLDTSVGISQAVSCAALNSSNWWVGCWDDNVDRDATCNIYNLATASGSDLDVDTEVVGGASTYPNAISVTAHNSTHWICGYYDRNESDMSFNTYNFRTAIGAVNDEDTNVGNVAKSVHVAAINNTHWAIFYIDNTDQDGTWSVYQGETRVKGPVDADDTLGLANAAIRGGVINDSYVAVMYYDVVDYDLTFSINGTTGATTAILAPTDIEQNISDNKPFRYHDIAAYRPATGLSLCNRSMAIVYANSTTQAVFRTYDANGNQWDGSCDDEPPAFVSLLYAGNPNESQFGSDTSARYYRNGTWQTEDWINITVNVSDNIAVDTVLVEWKNETEWKNYTMSGGIGGVFSINITGQPTWMGYTFNIWANDSSWNLAKIYNWTFYDYEAAWGDKESYRKYIGLNSTSSDSLNYKQFYFYNISYTSGMTDDRVLPHEQPTEGTFTDSGIMRYMKPTTMNSLNCSSFVGAFLDEAMRINQTNISNIYVHMWWNSSSEASQANEGVGFNMENTPWLANTLRCPTEGENGCRYNLYYNSSKMNITTTGHPKSGYMLDSRYWNLNDTFVDDNNASIFVMKVLNAGQNVSIISDGNYSSFVIFNLPSNETLSGLDTDSDELTDFDELYVNWTDPYSSDTDGDGVSDSSDCGPLDPTITSICGGEEPSTCWTIIGIELILPDLCEYAIALEELI